MSCQKYSDRQDNILKTWGKNKDLYFFSEHSDSSRRVIKVCDDVLGDYQSLTIKFSFLFPEIKKSFYDKYEWYFIGSDDNFVNTKLLEDMLETFDKNKIHGWDYTGEFPAVKYLSGGAGMLINRILIHKFFDDYNVGPFGHGGHIYSDVTFGVNMAEKNVEFVHNHLFLPEHPSRQHAISFDGIYNYYACHRITTFEEMNELNNVCLRRFEK